MNKAIDSYQWTRKRSLHSLLLRVRLNLCPTTSFVIAWPFLLLPASVAASLLSRILGQDASGCSSKNARVGFLKLRKHFRAVLSLRQTAGKQLYWFKDLVPEFGVSNNEDCFLKHIVSELVSYESLYDKFYAEILAAGLGAKFPHERCIILDVCSFENLIDLHCSLLRFETLLDDVWRELKLAESDEIAGNEVQDLVVSLLVIEFEDVLH